MTFLHSSYQVFVIFRTEKNLLFITSTIIDMIKISFLIDHFASFHFPKLPPKKFFQIRFGKFFTHNSQSHPKSNLLNPLTQEKLKERLRKGIVTFRSFHQRNSLNQDSESFSLTTHSLNLNQTFRILWHKKN